MAFAVIGTAFLVASVWSGIGSPKALGNLGEGLGLAIDNIKALDAKKKVIISVVCIACSLPVFIYRGIDPVHLRLVPKAATDFIVENELPAPILNSFGIGGYIMYRFSNPDGTPRIKVPIDGRTNVNSPEITKAFVEALQGTYKWTDMMDLVKPRTIIWDVEHPLTTILLVHPDYCLVYPEKQEDLDKETYAVFLTKQDCPTWWSKIAKEILPEALVH
jgi:hypothetical protein